jgi:hypothetical protein
MTKRFECRPALSLATIIVCVLVTSLRTMAAPKPDRFWAVDEIRTGMRGYGKTVMQGTKVESFDAEVIGVLKNVSPGRDMVLCRLSGLNLEKTGVIAGMSGSPVYIDSRLLGAVAYAWPFGKEPIAGITPFSQMHGFVEAYERRDLAERQKPTRVGLNAPVRVGGQTFDSVTVSETFDPPVPAATDGLWMQPLRTPLAATGFTPRSLALLQERCGSAGLMPMQGGGTSTAITEREKNTPLEPGGPLAISMVAGDFDLSGMGTVTHIEGDRVYGWGHPFMGLGACEFPLWTGYVHTIYPRQSISFKMGSPLRPVGVINADVSTCIAGWLERKPDLMPLAMRVRCCPGDSARTFNVQVVRQRSLLATLVVACLANSVDMQGELPEELTADLHARIETEGHEPLEFEDTYSGPSFSGGRAPVALYNQIGVVVNMLLYNSYQPIRITKIECDTRIHTGRHSADIEAVELDSETYSPGEMLQATVFVRPYKGVRQKIPVKLPLPADLPEGSYTAMVCDDLANVRAELRDDPTLASPQSLEQVFQSLRVHTRAKRTNVVLRVPTDAAGVALGGNSLRNLPPGMVQILSGGRRTGAQPVGAALVSRQPTPWVLQGSESVRFTVTKNKGLAGEE